MSTVVVEKWMVDRARRAARAVGMRVVKSRSRNPLINAGGLLLVDERNIPAGPSDYSLSAEDVLEHCDYITRLAS